MSATQTIKWLPFSQKQKDYVKNSLKAKMSVAEGAVRSSKTILNCISACAYLEECEDKIHLASGSSLPNAKMNIGDCNGFGLEHLFRGRCRWGKYKENSCLYIYTKTGEKIVIFAGGGKADSYKKILGNSYGLWIATEINEHYDCEDSRMSFIKVAFGRQTASRQPKVLWDLNPSNPDAPIYKDYIDLYKETYVGGYNYQHFTMKDNLSITEERMKEIESQYIIGSVWYRRDILGERCIAEGLCYDELANNREKFWCDKNYFKDKIGMINVGVDFGGNRSATTFCATAITKNMREVIVVRGKRIKKSLSPVELEEEFNNFCIDVFNEFERSMRARCDSVETTLINGLKISSAKKFGRIQILNAIKGKINNRIALTNKLTAKKRLWFYKDGDGVEEVMNSLCKCVYDKDKVDERLDIVSFENPIDMADAFEYSIEEFSKELTMLNA